MSRQLKVGHAVPPAKRCGELVRWQSLTLALLVVGYSGYYLCRSNLSVTMPLIDAEMTARGITANAARIACSASSSRPACLY